MNLFKCLSRPPRAPTTTEHEEQEHRMIPAPITLPIAPAAPPPPPPGPLLSWRIEKEARVGILCPLVVLPPTATTATARRDCSRSPVEFFLNRLFAFAEPLVLIPPGAAAVSLAAENFRVGDSPTHFVPAPPPPRGVRGSVTYQKVSRHVTATYLNVAEKAFLAGLTFVFDAALPSDPSDVVSLELAWLVRRRFPDEHVVHNEPKYGRDCGRAGGRVLVGCNGVNRLLLHYRWHWEAGEFRTDYCVECEASQAETTSTVVAAHLGIDIRPPPPPANSPQPSLTNTIDDVVSRLSDVTADDFSSNFSQIDTDEAD